MTRTGPGAGAAFGVKRRAWGLSGATGCAAWASSIFWAPAASSLASAIVSWHAWVRKVWIAAEPMVTILATTWDAETKPRVLSLASWMPFSANAARQTPPAAILVAVSGLRSQSTTAQPERVTVKRATPAMILFMEYVMGPPYGLVRLGQRGQRPHATPRVSRS